MKAVLKPNRVREAVKARRYAEKALTTFIPMLSITCLAETMPLLAQDYCVLKVNLFRLSVLGVVATYTLKMSSWTIGMV